MQERERRIDNCDMVAQGLSCLVPGRCRIGDAVGAFSCWNIGGLPEPHVPKRILCSMKKRVSVSPTLVSNQQFSSDASLVPVSCGVKAGSRMVWALSQSDGWMLFEGTPIETWVPFPGLDTTEASRQLLRKLPAVSVADCGS